MSASKKPDKRRKKQRPGQRRGSEATNLGYGGSPVPASPPFSMFSAEQVLRELHEAMEGHDFSSQEEVNAFISAFNQRGMKPPGQSKSPKNRKHEAQDLAYQAMETRDPVRSAKLCEKAIELDPHCVDALMHLTRLSCEDGEEMIESMRMVVEIGERGLGGKAYFNENKGYFWGLMETRPYMRARAYLAQLLLEAGKNDAAIEHYEEMLRLNPNDNQGLRYPLLGIYLLAGRMDSVRRLLKEFEDEGSAVFAWGLVLERHRSGDEDGAAKALKEARTCNKHVEKYLTGKKARPRHLPAYYGIGDENEAIICADAIGDAWKQNPRTVKWLKQAN